MEPGQSIATKEKQAIYETVLPLFTDKYNIEAYHGSITNSQAWKNFLKYLETSDIKSVYIETYLGYLKPFIIKFLNDPDMWRIRISRLNHGLVEIKLDSDNMLTGISQGSRDQFNYALNKLNVKSSLNVRVCGGGDGGSFGCHFELENEMLQTILHNNSVIKDQITRFKRFTAINSIPINDQVIAYLNIAEQQLLESNHELVSKFFLSPETFATKDVYMQTAVRAAITVLDEAGLKQFKKNLSDEFCVFDDEDEDS